MKQYTIEPTKIQRLVGEMKFYPTNGDRSCISYINKRIEELGYWKYEIDNFENFPFLKIVSSSNEIGSKLVNGKSIYIKPIDEMMKLINEYV